MYGPMLRSIMQIVPNLFTLGNLLCGYLAVINVIEGALTHAAWWIIIAAFFDYFDGKVARMTHTACNFGVEFDSIVDVISFGIAPAVLFHQYMLIDAGNLGYFLAYLFVGAGAIRLARFNVAASTEKKPHFTGMPIPAGAGILSSFVLFGEHVWNGLASFDLAVAVLLLTSIAMVSQFRYATMPRINFGSLRETAMSTVFITLMFSIILFPDEIFFPMGIVYLFSGPLRSVTVPAYHFVAHRGHDR